MEGLGPDGEVVPAQPAARSFADEQADESPLNESKTPKPARTSNNPRPSATQFAQLASLDSSSLTLSKAELKAASSARDRIDALPKGRSEQGWQNTAREIIREEGCRGAPWVARIAKTMT